MNKAILVIDMPESCSKCPLFGDHYADMCCKGLNNRGIDYPYPEDFRQDWCPLKPEPLNRNMRISEPVQDAWFRGYEQCLRSILGEEDGEVNYE